MDDNSQNNSSQFAPPSSPDGTLNLQAPAVKEQKETPARVGPEKVSLVEIKELEPVKELAGWMEKLEKGEDIQLPQPVTDDYGQILVQSAAPQKPKVTLPLDDNQLKFGLGQTMANSLRWLAEWCLRLLKMWPGRIEYKQIKS